MEIISIGILLIAIAFAIAVVYLSLVLYRLSRTMRTLSKNMGEAERQMQYITPELTQTMKETEDLVDDLQEKITASESIVDSAEDMGKSLNAFNEIYQEYSKAMTDEAMMKKIKPFVSGMQWSEAAFQLFSNQGQEKSDASQTANETN